MDLQMILFIALIIIFFIIPLLVFIIKSAVKQGILEAYKIIKNDKDKAIQYANVAIQENPKRIVEKIKNDVTFAIIIAKLSIPFNLEVEEEEVKENKLTKKEIRAKEHLEQMVEITKKIGYNDVGITKKNINTKDDIFGINYKEFKERE